LFEFDPVNPHPYDFQGLFEGEPVGLRAGEGEPPNPAPIMSRSSTFEVAVEGVSGREAVTGAQAEVRERFRW
jgi:hypothetical protein